MRWDLEPRSTNTVCEAYEEFIWAASLALSTFRNHLSDHHQRPTVFYNLRGSAIKLVSGRRHEKTWVKFFESQARQWQALGGTLQKGPNGGDQFYEQRADGQLQLVVFDSS